MGKQENNMSYCGMGRERVVLVDWLDARGGHLCDRRILEHDKTSVTHRYQSRIGASQIYLQRPDQLGL